jgi:hypothetical protein
MRLRELPGLTGRPATTAGVRLPGWTGGPGYFVGDGDAFVIARSESRPQIWQPVLLEGRWLTDEFGSGWLQVARWRPVGSA